MFGGVTAPAAVTSRRRAARTAKPPVTSIPAEGTVFYADEEALFAQPPPYFYHEYRWALRDIFVAAGQPLAAGQGVSAAAPAAGQDEIVGSIDRQNTQGDVRFDAVIPRLRAIFDDQSRFLLNNRRPSNFVGSNLDVYTFYRPVASAAEKEIEELLFRVIVLSRKADRIREAFTRLRDKKYRAIYKHTARAVIDLVSPPPHSLDEYGEQNPKKPLLSIDPLKRDYLNEAILEDLVYLFGKADRTVRTPRDYLASVTNELAGVVLDMNTSLLVDYRRTIALLQVVTAYERDNLVTPSLARLNQIWTDVEKDFRQHVFRSVTLDELERTFTEDIGRRAEQTVAVLKAYNRNFPLLDDDSGVENAPTSRDNTLILGTATGRRIINFYRLTRNLSFAPSSARFIKLLSDEIPQGLMFAGQGDDVDTALNTTLYSRALENSVDSMDLIFFYFSIVNPSAPWADRDQDERSFYDVYWELVRKKEITALIKKRVKDGLAAIRATRLGADGLGAVGVASAASMGYVVNPGMREGEGDE